jgi:hypothetical protein
MHSPPLAQFVPVLQTAIGPALLISGIGLLLLSLVNRINHVTDRTRILVEQMRHESGNGGQAAKAAQLTILWRRAQIVRVAIVFAAGGALLAALLIVDLFVSGLYGIEDAWLISLLFVSAMASLILSLVCFIADVNQSLHALRLELEHARSGDA